MHEAALALSLLSIVLKEAETVGANRVLSITVQAGEYAAINEYALTFAWEIAAKGTAAAGAQLLLQAYPGSRDLIIESMEVQK
ncbi:MAG TPA: hydrogenase maturation nickel metallochaperone HypA [Firmicutes bacterium]|nr:hydrogenase maturation nickel metallochaperone HypA [Bacillota bacterium]